MAPMRVDRGGSSVDSAIEQQIIAIMKNPICCLVLLLSASARSSSFSSPAFSPRSSLIRPDRANPGGVSESVNRNALSARGGDAPDAEAPEPSSKLGPNAPPPGLLRRALPSFPWHLLPNYLTYARCLSIPIFLALCYYPADFPNRAPVLSVLFAAASITDWFDGFLARRWDITSPFGAFLDPVADKLMVSTALIALAGRYGGIVAIPAAVIMAREVGVSALREWMAQQGKRDSVKVGMQGKVKAALTMVSLSLMLLVPGNVGLEDVAWTKCLGSLGTGGVVETSQGAGLPWMLGPSLLMLFASAVITITSGSVYFKAAWPVLLGKE